MIKRIPLKISNAYLVKEQGAILIDTGSPGEAPRILKALEKHGCMPGSVRLLVHTHAHVDHAGSSALLMQAHGWASTVQAADAAHLAAGTNGPVQPRSLLGWLIQKAVFADYPPVTGAMVFDAALDLAPYGVAGKLLHTPGHTPGSCSVVLDNGGAIVGDLFMGGFLGGYLAPGVCGYHYFINNKEQLHQSIARLLQLPVEVYYTGHGGPVSRKAVMKKFGWLLG